MKTHFLLSGVPMPADEMSARTRCNTNKGSRVQISENIDFVDCDRCRKLAQKETSEGNLHSIVSTPRKELETVYYSGERVHYGEDGVGIGPDEKTFCGRKARTSADAISTSRREEVTCKRCLARI